MCSEKGEDSGSRGRRRGWAGFQIRGVSRTCSWLGGVRELRGVQDDC